ncbi:unnamed protein product [Rotaria sp. Silwood1]|nr:unnamed protein product [Rotaria sp. Silwood1]CAF4947153.1 unnamed protein product [Rotaria sp. Silwood1]
MSSVKQYIPRSSSYASSQSDINILMLGETGVGKSTFINAFANYIIYNTLNEAIKSEMQVLIPSTFHITDSHTEEIKKILIGTPSDDERCEEIGQLKGLTQDVKDCDHILAYVNQYEHLNSICILLKPNHERLTINFRFCFKEILTHLHINAKDNLMFIFTNGRGTFYRPDHTFIFDNEAFRYLATYKNGIKFSTEEITNFSKSLEISVKEFTRLIERILKCELHAIRDSLSINAA